MSRDWAQRAAVLFAATLSLALMAAAPAANAAAYRGVIDPQFGAPFGDLGWRGEIEVFVPDACVPTGTADVSNVGACGSGATVTSAFIELYDVTASGQPTIETLTYAPPTSLVDDLLRFVNGNLTGLEASLGDFTSTSASLFIAPGTSGAPYGAGPNSTLDSLIGAPVDFFLEFLIDGQTNTVGNYSGPLLSWSNAACDCGGQADIEQFPPVLSFTRIDTVPEPGTLGLLLAALGAAFVARRPRRSR